MDNIFIESMTWQHDILCDIDSYFIEMSESIMRCDEYIFEDASSKGEGLFAKIGKLIKKILDGIKNFFTGKNNDETDTKVKQMEQELKNNPSLKDKKSKIIDPRKVRKLTKEDFKKGAKAVVPCIISAGIPTAILLYKNRNAKIEAQKLEGEVMKIKKDLESTESKLNSSEIKTNNMLKTIKTVSDKSIENRKEAERMRTQKKESEASNQELKKEITKLTEELDVKNKQLNILKDSQKQIEHLATGGTGNTVDNSSSGNSSSDTSSEKTTSSKELQKKVTAIVNSYKTIYKTANVSIDDSILIKQVKGLFKSKLAKDKILANGITSKSVDKGTKATLLKRWANIVDSINDVKSSGTDQPTINELITNYHKSYNNSK